MKLSLAKINWKIKLAIVLIIASALFYTFAVVYFHNPEHVFFYIIIDLAFVPMDVLIVALVIENIIGKKEKEAVFEKLDMILGAFFTEIGDFLLAYINEADEEDIIKNLDQIKYWEEKDYKDTLEKIKKANEKGLITFNPKLTIEERNEFIKKLRIKLNEKRPFLISLLENPNLLEKDHFSSLLLALFHLQAELNHREDISKITDKDFEHLRGDITRVYSKLLYEWVNYLYYIKKHYPYMSSIAIRTNPFDKEIEIYVND